MKTFNGIFTLHRQHSIYVDASLQWLGGVCFHLRSLVKHQ